jgi:hypothetical protein
MSEFVDTAANGVVIATEKKLPSILVDESSVWSSLNSSLPVLYNILERHFMRKQILFSLNGD